MALWQSIAALWINKNSSWELIKVSIIKRMLSALFLVLIVLIPLAILTL
jgi:hypothetical protein